MYAENPPWEIGRPQPAFAAVAEAGGLGASVLDVGCGTGEHALLAAQRGSRATGVDLSPRAIATARDKAAARGLTARFLLLDALQLATLGERFDTVMDSGLFHIFGDADRAAYVQSRASATVPGGRCHLLCFSDLEPGDWGPRRVRRDEIVEAFASGWKIESVDRVTMETTIDPPGRHAWLATVTRS
jgi:cyclopropane fatty-acyl-phospholipid synthase-like methyltransferase